MKGGNILLVVFITALFTSKVNAQRNVVLIIADDLSPDYFGFYEDYVDTVAVPNIRALVRKGVRFKNAQANPVCSSTRAGIVTGRYSFRTGVGYIVGSTAGSGQIDTAEITIPKLLTNFNPDIASANIGKWHLNQPTPASNLIIPLALGYQHFEGPFIGQLTSYTNWTKFTNGVSSIVTTYATTENVNNAVSWIKTVNVNNPFFLWMAFNSPHEPLHLPPAGLHNFSNLTGTAADINANPKQYFKAMIQAMDHEIGRFLDSLQVLNRLDSTDVIFIGDNGNTMRTAQIANFTRAKGTIYEYGIHIPLIIAGPTVVSPNRVSDALVNSVDLFATVQELMGNSSWSNQIPQNRPVDSKSLLPVINNSNNQIRPWAFSELFKNITDTSDGKTIRNASYKLLKFDNGIEKFYNLATDPLELNDMLTGVLTTTEQINFDYLCNEMTLLLGSGNYCNSNVSTYNDLKNNFTVFPNPFSNAVYLTNQHKGIQVKLLNMFNQLIYSGNNISNEDFTYLPAGMYYLIFENTSVVKLIKE